MTDNEIVKALECCAHRTCNECIRQPIEYGRTERDCKSGLMKLVLRLINRQKSEIEWLNKEVDRLSQLVLYHDGDVADAIKEFAERVKKLAYEGYSSRAIPECVFVSVEEIDNLVKEMAGDV